MRAMAWWLAAGFLLVAGPARPASADVLTVGSKAPAIDIEHWLQDRQGAFKPVRQLAPGKVYVIEFWGTNCPPCRASMPQIAKLQDAFFDKGVTIIGVSHEDPKLIEQFLDQNAGNGRTFREVTQAYCLTSDPDGSVSKDYLEAAGLSVIPTAFIVGKTGEVEWIGHPMEMEEPLARVVAGTWDRAAHMAEKKEMETIQARLAGLDGLLQGDDPTRAVAVVDELIAGLTSPKYKQRLEEIREQVVAVAETETIRKAVAKGGPEAVAVFGKLVAQAGDSAEELNAAAWVVAELVEQKVDVSPELFAAALAAGEKAAALAPKSAMTLDTLAHLQARGDLDKAIATQRKAVEYAEPAEERHVRRYLRQLESRRKP